MSQNFAILNPKNTEISHNSVLFAFLLMLHPKWLKKLDQLTEANGSQFLHKVYTLKNFCFRIVFKYLKKRELHQLLVDVKEYLNGSHKSSSKAICMDVPGSFKCTAAVN